MLKWRDLVSRFCCMFMYKVFQPFIEYIQYIGSKYTPSTKKINTHDILKPEHSNSSQNKVILWMEKNSSKPVEMSNVTGFIGVYIYIQRGGCLGFCESSTTTFTLSRQSPAILQETNHMSNLIALSGSVGIPPTPPGWDAGSSQVSRFRIQ